jgi:hypothetical protein
MGVPPMIRKKLRRASDLWRVAVSFFCNWMSKSMSMSGTLMPRFQLAELANAA